ncbi:MAG TPA: hypothetical protein PLQ54_15470, partial [Armatimonadota bacterium]|nr:hypothetical protein [Armatimonadota bacterium]
PGWHSHAISDLDDIDLCETLFIFFQGCSSAKEVGGIRELCAAVTNKGAQAYAGFEGHILSEFFSTFASEFWECASRQGNTISEARVEAVWAVADANSGEDAGYASFWCTNPWLELFPPRFSDACVGP